MVGRALEVHSKGNTTLENRLAKVARNPNRFLDGDAYKFLHHMGKKVFRNDKAFSLQKFVDFSPSDLGLEYVGVYLKDRGQLFRAAHRYSSDAVCIRREYVFDDVQKKHPQASLEACVLDAGKQNLVIPLEFRGESFGYVVTKKRKFALKDVATVLEAVDMLGSTFSMMRRNDYLEKLATVDDLTRCFNRRKFRADIDVEINQSKRKRTPLAMLMIDVDYFKKINDTYGHLHGDGVLRAVTKMIQSGVKRKGDVVYRYGGEEFAVLLPQTSLDKATKVASRIQAAISDHEFKIDIPKDVAERKYFRRRGIHDVTVSIGIASTEDTGADDPHVYDIIARADKNLYNAKGSGRNQYSVSKPMVDRLTGLENATGFTMRLEKSLEQSSTNCVTTCLFIFDILHFSQYLNGYGNSAWRRIVKPIAQKFNGEYKSRFDYVCRLGQRDRFAAVVDTVDAMSNIENSAPELARDICGSIGEMEFEVSDGGTPISHPVPLAAGIVAYNHELYLPDNEVPTAAKFLESADLAVTRASEAEGRVFFTTY